MIFKIAGRNRVMAAVVATAMGATLAAADSPSTGTPEPKARLARAVDRDGQIPKAVMVAPGHCAWPNLQVLNDGKTLAALIFNAASHGRDPGDVECWLSSDGGVNWSLGSAVTQHEPGTIRMNHAAGLAANGDLMVLTSGWSDRYPADKPRGALFRHSVLSPWVSRSPDGGRSWWVDKTAFPEKTPLGEAPIPFGDVHRAKNGDLCVSVYSKQGPGKLTWGKDYRAYLYRSTDDGKSWGEPAVIGPDSNETPMLHVGDGRWLAAARTRINGTKEEKILLFGSTDDGRTWNLKRDLTGSQQITGHLLKLRDGRILCTYGDRASPPGKKGVETIVSTDGGETWSEPIRLADWNGPDGGYPSSVERADGQIVTGYYASALPDQAADSTKGYHLGVIVWSPEKSLPKR